MLSIFGLPTPMALTLVSWMGPFGFYDMRLNQYCLPLQLVQVEKLDLILIKSP